MDGCCSDKLKAKLRTLRIEKVHESNLNQQMKLVHFKELQMLDLVHMTGIKKLILESCPKLKGIQVRRGGLEEINLEKCMLEGVSML